MDRRIKMLISYALRRPGHPPLPVPGTRRIWHLTNQKEGAHMSRRRNRIVLAAGITIAVIAAMAGPAGAHASAGGQASAPVPVDVTGDITWIWDHTPAGETGTFHQYGRFHIDLTDVTNGGTAVGGNSSTYSISDRTNVFFTAGDCNFHVTGAFDGSGFLPYYNLPLFYGNFLNVGIQPSTGSTVSVVIQAIYTETSTTIEGGPPPCLNTTFSGTQRRAVVPVCTSTGPNGGLNGNGGLYGTFQGTYPNGTVDLGCSGTYANNSDSGSFSVNGTLRITPSNATTKLAFIQQPSSTAAVGQPLSIQPQVAVEDANGNTVTSDTSTVTLSVGAGSTGSGKLTCTGGLSQAAVNGVASFTGCQFDAAGTYVIQATDGTLAPANSDPIAGSCTIGNSGTFDAGSVTWHAGGSRSSSHLFTAMLASFTPTTLGIPITLAAAASECGFQGFDWQQQFTNMPSPSGLKPFNPLLISPANIASDGSLHAGKNIAADGSTQEAPSFNDPPPGGYLSDCGRSDEPYSPYIVTCPPGDTSYPFYWETSVQRPGHETSYELDFDDIPASPCLPGGDPKKQAIYCDGLSDYTGSFWGLTTALVGINPDGSASAPLVQWTWTDTFNGTSGGIPTSKNVNPVDPNSGSGGVTITSINGVPQTPPSVSCSATPSILWPPDGKSVVVAVSGTITPGTQDIPSDGTTYAVTDKYGQVQPTGSIALGAGGSYSFGVPLVASRDGSDKDGRTYVITVTATDNLGNVGTCSATITVPHDQG